MKKLILITLFLTVLLGTINLKAQTSDLYSYMEQYLSNDDKDQIERAKSNFDKGKKLDAQIQEEDAKVNKYFSKKAKKGEKKSVEVKTLRIKQALYYEQAYALIYNVYAEKVGSATFIYEDDEAKVKNLMDEAAADNASAKKKMKDYKSVTPKDLKKDISYSKVKSDIEGMTSLYESSINKLIEAQTVIVDQEQKKQLEDAENSAWQNAQSEGTIYSYQSYLNDYPNGKYASDARSLIANLEAAEKKKEDDMKSRDLTNVKFEVQIAASKKKLSKWKIGQIYRAASEVHQKEYDGWFKYSVGDFKTYEDAKTFATKTKVKGAFVVAFRNGKKIDIAEVVKK